MKTPDQLRRAGLADAARDHRDGIVGLGQLYSGMEYSDRVQMIEEPAVRDSIDAVGQVRFAVQLEGGWVDSPAPHFLEQDEEFLPALRARYPDLASKSALRDALAQIDSLVTG